MSLTSVHNKSLNTANLTTKQQVSTQGSSTKHIKVQFMPLQFSHVTSSLRQLQLFSGRIYFTLNGQCWLTSTAAPANICREPQHFHSIRNNLPPSFQHLQFFSCRFRLHFLSAVVDMSTSPGSLLVVASVEACMSSMCHKLQGAQLRSLLLHFCLPFVFCFFLPSLQKERAATSPCC